MRPSGVLDPDLHLAAHPGLQDLGETGQETLLAEGDGECPTGTDRGQDDGGEGHGIDPTDGLAGSLGRHRRFEAPGQPCVREKPLDIGRKGLHERRVGVPQLDLHGFLCFRLPFGRQDSTSCRTPWGNYIKLARRNTGHQSHE